VHNPAASLVLYCNTDLQRVAPPDVSPVLQALGVSVQIVEITFRLPRGSVARFGNQFYVLDVIRDFCSGAHGDALVLTDSDCIWRQSAAELAKAVGEHRCLLYTLAPADQKGYEVGRLLNGMSHARMTEVAAQEFNVAAGRSVEYHGGEFFAATLDYCRDIQPRVTQLWQRACHEATLADAIKEEAHFLSIIAEGAGITRGTGNRFIRRIWTNFEDLNPVADDLDLTVWHLPAEKRFGFRRLWQFLANNNAIWLSYTPSEVNRLTARYMGIPKRSPTKFALDVGEKVFERTTLLRHFARSKI
jgi:hypothetical protein